MTFCWLLNFIRVLKTYFLIKHFYFQSIVLFLNCGHVCSCRLCSQKVVECPLCRAEIIQKVVLSISSKWDWCLCFLYIYRLFYLSLSNIVTMLNYSYLNKHLFTHVIRRELKLCVTFILLNAVLFCKELDINYWRKWKP